MGKIGLNTKGLVTEIWGNRSINFENLSLVLSCSKNYEIFMVDGSGCPLHYIFLFKGIGLEL